VNTAGSLVIPVRSIEKETGGRQNDDRNVQTQLMSNTVLVNIMTG